MAENLVEWSEAQKALQEEINKKRFYTIDNSGKTDTFMRAMIILGSAAEIGIGIFNRKSRTKEFMGFMDDLYLTDFDARSKEEQEVIVAEWEAFASLYIKTCLTDKNYGSYVFGLIRMKDADIVNRIEADFKKTLYDYPRELGKEEMVKPFYDTLVRVLEKRKPEILKEFEA